MLGLMRHLRYMHEPLRSIAGASLRYWFGVARRLLAQGSCGLSKRRPRPKTIAVVSLVLGFLVNVILVCLVWYLIDLVILLMEVWAELAAKHLEITLDTTS